MMALQGCATSSSNTPLQISLPPPPGYLAPVAVPSWTAATDARDLSGRLLVSLDAANGRLSAGRAWYGCVAVNFAAGKVTCK